MGAPRSLSIWKPPLPHLFDFPNCIACATDAIQLKLVISIT
jgi:hypothetical protein